MRSIIFIYIFMYIYTCLFVFPGFYMFGPPYMGPGCGLSWVCTWFPVIIQKNIIPVFIKWWAFLPLKSMILIGFIKIKQEGWFFSCKIKTFMVCYWGIRTIVPPNCWYLIFTFSYKKVSKHFYLLVIHISEKCENYKMHRNCKQNCTTYSFMELTSPPSVSISFTLELSHKKIITKNT